MVKMWLVARVYRHNYITELFCHATCIVCVFTILTQIWEEGGSTPLHIPEGEASNHVFQPLPCLHYSYDINNAIQNAMQ